MAPAGAGGYIEPVGSVISAPDGAGYIVRCADSVGLKYRTMLCCATRYLPDFSLYQRVYFIEQQGIDAGSGAGLYLDFISPNSRESGMLLPFCGNYTPDLREFGLTCWSNYATMSSWQELWLQSTGNVVWLLR